MKKYVNNKKINYVVIISNLALVGNCLISLTFPLLKEI